MSKFLIAIFLSITFCIFSCRKDAALISSPTTPANNLNGMLILNYDSIILPPTHNRLINLDLNADGKYDITITGGVWQGAGHIQLSESYIQPLHPDCYLATSVYYDTTFLHISKSLDSYSNAPALTINYYYSYLCNRYDSTDIVTNDTIINRLIYFPSEKNSMDSTNNWTNNKYYFCEANNPLPSISILYSSPDTVIQKFVNTKSACHQLTSDNITFVGVKLITVNGVKYGWLKLMQTTNKPSLLIMSTAIQK